MPRTPLGLLNFLILQWFFIRLSRAVYFDVESTTKDAGTVSLTLVSSSKRVGWRWMVGVVPLTGWWSDYRFVRGRG